MIVNSCKQNLNTPSFKQRIIISPEIYNGILKRGHYVGYPWTIEEAFIGYRGYTRNASVCTIAYLQPEFGSEGFLSHIVPSSQNIDGFDSIKRRFTEVTEQFVKLKDNLNGKVSGILIGGKKYSETNHVARNSEILYEKLLVLFQDLGINSTVILGSNRNTFANLYFSTSGNHVVANVTDNLGKPVRTLPDLQEWFDIVNIHPNDTVDIYA